MNRLSKRILSCAAAGLIAIPLALFQTGCNPTTTESKTTSDVMGSVVRKYVWYQNIPAGEKAADEYFEKETGAKVERVMVSWDNIDLKFDDSAIERIAEISVELNATSEDIGARRLHTVMEYLLEDISFNAGGGDYPTVTLNITKQYVDEHLSKLTGDRDLKKYVL